MSEGDAAMASEDSGEVTVFHANLASLVEAVVERALMSWGCWTPSDGGECSLGTVLNLVRQPQWAATRRGSDRVPPFLRRSFAPGRDARELVAALHPAGELGQVRLQRHCP